MARPKLGESESKRLQMIITEDELEAIETWQHANRIASKSEAIRRLAALGIALDRLVGEVSAQRATLWQAYDMGSEKIVAAAEAAQLGRASWKEVAMEAITVVGDLAEPQGRLSHAINALARQASALRSSDDFENAIKTAHQAESDAKTKISALMTAFSELEERNL